MNRNRLIATGIIGAIVLAAAAGWVMGISPVVDQISAAHAQQAALATTNTASAARLAVLKKLFANMAVLQGKLSTLQLSVPMGADIQSFLTEISSLSSATGVSLTNLTVGTAATYVAPIAPVAAEPTAPTDATASPSPSPSASSSTTATGIPVAPAGPSSRLVVVPITVLVTGSYSQVMSFSGALQGGARLFRVTAVTLNGSTTDLSFSGKLEGNIFALPAEGVSVASSPGSIAVTPAPSPSPSPSSSPRPSPSATPTGSPSAKP